MLESAANRHAARVFSIAQNTPGDRGGNLDAPILRSWERCLDTYGLDPTHLREPHVLEHPHLVEEKERLDDVLSIASHEMNNLYQQIAGSGYAILLTNARGVILNCVSDSTQMRLFHEAGLGVGAVWSEQQEGTNGIGTCLAEKTPVTVHRDEHFRSRHINLTCSASPIFDPHGHLLAVLDASSTHCRDSKQSQFHTVALTTMSAKLIENGHFLHHFRDQWVLRFHTRPEYVGLLSEGMLAFDGEGAILAANQSALNQINGQVRDRLIGQPVSHVFDISIDALIDRASHQPSTVWPIHDRQGRGFFARLRGMPPRIISGRTAAPTGRLQRRSDAPSLPRVDGTLDMSLTGLAGNDPMMTYNVRCARRVMDKGISLLLAGETGTGKEAFAKAVHEASRRAGKTFVAVNCASIPESLIESELFGYRHGAFTGARKEGMRGKILQSSGGTLFLDEIGDMPHTLQTRLLRVLEEREIQPLGCEQSLPVDLHVISASHRDLPELVAGGQFREDLYYRLNGLTLTLPSLRDRADRMLLIRRMLAAESGDQPVEVDPDAFAALGSYPWPGNLRQLRNVLRTAAALCEDGVVRLEDLPPEVSRCSPQDLATRLQDAPAADPARAPAPPPPEGNDSALDSAERQALLGMLERHRWNVTNTAAQLGISRNTLYRKMKKHGITPPRLA